MDLSVLVNRKNTVPKTMEMKMKVRHSIDSKNLSEKPGHVDRLIKKSIKWEVAILFLVAWEVDGVGPVIEKWVTDSIPDIVVYCCDVWNRSSAVAAKLEL